MSYDIRSYRSRYLTRGLVSFPVVIKETDLLVRVDEGSFTRELPGLVEQLVWRQRQALEKYIAAEPEFKTTRGPFLVSPGAPGVALLMARAGNLVGVGPMAAVAGAFAHLVGQELLKQAREVIVENGGDLFMKASKVRKVSLLLPEGSPFQGRLALEIRPEDTPLGICTSSGVIGPSYSEGKADAVVVLSPSTLLADAAATALGNLVGCREGVGHALAKSQEIPGLQGVLIVKGDRLGAWGKIKLVPE